MNSLPLERGQQDNTYLDAWSRAVTIARHCYCIFLGVVNLKNNEGFPLDNGAIHRYQWDLPCLSETMIAHLFTLLVLIVE